MLYRIMPVATIIILSSMMEKLNMSWDKYDISIIKFTVNTSLISYMVDYLIEIVK